MYGTEMRLNELLSLWILDIDFGQNVRMPVVIPLDTVLLRIYWKMDTILEQCRNCWDIQMSKLQ